jgi:predicted nucleic acid-binding protein
VYLIDTNVVSELRKKDRAHPGVRKFFRSIAPGDPPAYLSAITVGELQRGVALIRHRGDVAQAELLRKWLAALLRDHESRILAFDAESALVWGVLRVPNAHNELDKQIAAIALVHDLTVVTRNVEHFAATGVRLLDPFERIAAPARPC